MYILNKHSVFLLLKKIKQDRDNLKDINWADHKKNSDGNKLFYHHHHLPSTILLINK